VINIIIKQIEEEASKLNFILETKIGSIFRFFVLCQSVAKSFVLSLGDVNCERVLRGR
jgi:hypothetical protein